MLGWVVLVILIFIAGALAGYRLSWMDHYEKGRRDALPWIGETPLTAPGEYSRWNRERLRR